MLSTFEQNSSRFLTQLRNVSSPNVWDAQRWNALRNLLRPEFWRSAFTPNSVRWWLDTTVAPSRLDEFQTLTERLIDVLYTAEPYATNGDFASPMLAMAYRQSTILSLAGAMHLLCAWTSQAQDTTILPDRLIENLLQGTFFFFGLNCSANDQGSVDSDFYDPYNDIGVDGCDLRYYSLRNNLEELLKVDGLVAHLTSWLQETATSLGEPPILAFFDSYATAPSSSIDSFPVVVKEFLKRKNVPGAEVAWKKLSRCLRPAEGFGGILAARDFVLHLFSVEQWPRPHSYFRLKVPIIYVHASPSRATLCYFEVDISVSNRQTSGELYADPWHMLFQKYRRSFLQSLQSSFVAAKFSLLNYLLPSISVHEARLAQNFRWRIIQTHGLIPDVLNGFSATAAMGLAFSLLLRGYGMRIESIRLGRRYGEPIDDMFVRIDDEEFPDNQNVLRRASKLVAIGRLSDDGSMKHILGDEEAKEERIVSQELMMEKARCAFANGISTIVLAARDKSRDYAESKDIENAWQTIAGGCLHLTHLQQLVAISIRPDLWIFLYCDQQGDVYRKRQKFYLDVLRKHQQMTTAEWKKMVPSSLTATMDPVLRLCMKLLDR